LKQRLLRRILVLSQIECCPQHHIRLVNRCECGESQHLFRRKTSPFTCCKCGLDWAQFPCISVPQEHIELEQQCLLYYEFFFSKCTNVTLKNIFRLVLDQLESKKQGGFQLFDRANQFRVRMYQKKVSLGYLVHALLNLGIPLQDLIACVENGSSFV
jgi:hypothetical protein